jgi:phospholipid-binding lipoprotein MlaA
VKRALFGLVLFVLFGSVCAQDMGDMNMMEGFYVHNPSDFDAFAEFEDELQEQMDGVNVPDPLEPLNRGVWWLNDKLYVYFLEPVASGYSKVIPEGGRKSIDNAFENLQAPERFVNNLLQLKFADAGTELKRFALNSTVGVLGLYDPATEKYEIKPQKEDFGQTLGHYGVKPVVVLQLPLLGPSNLRDTVGMIPDMFLSPLYYIESMAVKIGLKSEDVVNKTSLRLGLYENLKKDRLDMYRFLQDAYQQKRLKEIEE